MRRLTVAKLLAEVNRLREALTEVMIAGSSVSNAAGLRKLVMSKEASIARAALGHAEQERARDDPTHD